MSLGKERKHGQGNLAHYWFRAICTVNMTIRKLFKKKKKKGAACTCRSVRQCFVKHKAFRLMLCSGGGPGATPKYDGLYCKSNLFFFFMPVFWLVCLLFLEVDKGFVDKTQQNPCQCLRVYIHTRADAHAHASCHPTITPKLHFIWDGSTTEWLGAPPSVNIYQVCLWCRVLRLCQTAGITRSHEFTCNRTK